MPGCCAVLGAVQSSAQSGGAARGLVTYGEGYLCASVPNAAPSAEDRGTRPHF